MSAPLLSVRGLRKYFPTRGAAGDPATRPRGLRRWLRHERAVVHAVEHIDLDIRRGETVGLVGESGCGKSTVARLILRLIEANAGEIRFDGQDLRRLPRRKLREARRRMQIVFQDPFASLNPRMQVGEAIGEGLRIHRIGTASEQRERVAELLDLVGLRPEHAERYPHEFSGGQRQRIGIARALALGPDLIVGDEPVSSLDVSIQAQILNLLLDLQAKLGLAYLLISHDLRVVRHLCDRVAVMYLGRIVEQGTVTDVYERPQHPYTIALLSAAPVAEPGTGRQRIVLRGDVPSPIRPPAGCPFHPRCRRAIERCSSERPELREVVPGHLAACHLAPLDAVSPLAQSTA